MSIRNFDFFEVFMKKIWISLISALYCGFTLGYMHFADPRTNAGALSTIGLDHPVLFALWGAGTYGVLYLLLYTMYNNCLLYTSPSPRDMRRSRMPSSA